MPIYEYQCKKCGFKFEELVGINEKSPTVCPSCGERKLQRLISQTNFQLKGTGWYVTDFKNGAVGAVGAQRAAPSCAAPPVSTPSGAAPEKKKDHK
jgi:putative FmdB family regulatory protein